MVEGSTTYKVWKRSDSIKPMLSKLQSIISDEELIAMEENERKNVEVQINRLRNIQVLLNTAVKEMEQYSAVVSQLDPKKSRNQTDSTKCNVHCVGK